MKTPDELLAEAEAALTRANEILGKADEAQKAAAAADAKTKESLATAEKTHAEATKILAEAAGATATAQKTEAEAAGALATAEKTRAEAQSTLAAVARATSDQRINELEKLISTGKGLVPALSEVAKNTVTVSKGDVLRQAELASTCLQIAADVAAAAMKDCVDGQTLVVTSSTALRVDVAHAQVLKAEAERHRDLLETLAEELREALKTLPRTALKYPGLHGMTALMTPGLNPVEGALAVGSVAAAGVTELAKLFEYDVAVTETDAEVPALAIHAALIGKLLAGGGSKPKLIRHETLGWSGQDSPCLSPLLEARAFQAELAGLRMQLQAGIKRARR